MKLSVKEMKMFKPYAASVPISRVLPIYSFLRFDDGIVNKSSREIFVNMTVSTEGSFLIDEKILMSFVDAVSGDEINVEIKDKQAILSCGKDKMKSPTDDIINFPVVQINEKSEVELDSNVLDEVKVALNFTSDNPNMQQAQCVFIGRGIVGATSGNTAYTKRIPEKLPELVLEKEVASVIKNFDHLEFSQSDSHKFFKNGIFVFGFAKTETKFLDLAPFSQLPADGVSFKIDKSEIIKFCETCISSCQGRPVVASMDKEKLTMSDMVYEIDYEKYLSSELPEFMFNPSLMLRCLKSLPSTEVSLMKHGNRCYITGAHEFVSIISEMAKIENIKK